MYRDAENQIIFHPFAPICDENSQILILGSFPSAQSRETGFYYAHPRNRFWKVISQLTGNFEVPGTTKEKIDFLLNNRIAVWDVIKACEVKGSSDASIKNVITNDIKSLVSNYKIKKLYANGNLAYSLYVKHSFNKTGIDIIKLPSTSPANARYSLDMLISLWSVICPFIKQ